MTWPSTLYELPRTLLGLHAWIAKNPPVSDGTLEDRIAILEVEAAARRVLLRYAYCYDAGDVEGLMEIYSEDCVVVNPRGTFVGRDAIRLNYGQAIDEREVAFHHLSNVAVAASPDRAEAWVSAYMYNLAIRDGNAGGTVASCIFHIRRHDHGAWKVVEFRNVISGQHGFGPQAARERKSPPLTPTRPETVADLLDDI
jgi:ketosteroid isomerase-like protein